MRTCDYQKNGKHEYKSWFGQILIRFNHNLSDNCEQVSI